jgi:glycosyltransferase involved in cell wall biosynthesis
MNILLINYEYPPIGAGAATATQQIANSLVALGHTPCVLTSGYRALRGVCHESGVKVVRLGSPRRRPEASSVFEMASFAALASARVRRLVQEDKIEAVIAFFSIPCGPVAWWAHSGSGVPYAVSLRGGDVPGTEPRLQPIHVLLTPFRRKILCHASAVVANSPGLKALAEAADPQLVRVIPNGVDTQFFHPRPTARRDGPFRFLFVGRFQPQKNLIWLMTQLASLAASSATPFTLDLVGDGPHRVELEAMAARLGLSPRLRWHGWLPRERLVAIYQSADAILNPSLYEGMPNVLLEAMACGLPVLASNVPGNDAVVIDGVTGKLFDLGDAPAFLTYAREWIIGVGRAERLGSAGRDRAVREFSWLNCTRSYLSIFSPL